MDLCPVLSPLSPLCIVLYSLPVLQRANHVYTHTHIYMYIYKNKRVLENVSISALNVRDIVCCVQIRTWKLWHMPCQGTAVQFCIFKCSCITVKPGEIWPQVLAPACIAEQFLKDADWVVGGGKSRSFSK